MAKKKTKKRDDKLWGRAEEIVKDQHDHKKIHDDEWALVQHIYQNMLKAKEKKKKKRKKAMDFLEEMFIKIAAQE